MDRLGALTLNIWNRQGPWSDRLPLIREGLQALRPDIVGLQEVLAMTGAGAPADADQAHEIADGLGYQVAVAPAWELGGGVKLCNAVLSRHPILEQHVLVLPSPAGEDTRSVAYALIDAPCGRVPVFVTHLAWKLHHGHVRIEQIKELVAQVANRAPRDGFPPLIMGDMNADPDADEMRYLRGLTALGGRSVYFADCWATTAGQDPTAPGYTPGYTYDRRNVYALRSREPSRRIDYIYVRGPDRALRGEPLACRVVFTEPRDGVFASDHFGVYAEIQAAPRPAPPY